jgi:integrase
MGMEMLSTASHVLPNFRALVMKLTDKTVAPLTLPKGKQDHVFWDDDIPLFGVRLRAGGAKRWVYQYRIGAKQRRVILGVVSAVSAAQARKTAAELHARVQLGEDPAGTKAEGRVRAAETMDAALRIYMARQRERLKPLSYRQCERHLVKHTKALHGLQLARIDRRTIATRLAAIAAKSGPIEANRVRTSLSAFFAWALRQGLVEANPVVGTEKRPEQSRDRVLNDDELRAIWAATAGDDDYSAIVRLLALTALRADEIASLRWSEVVGDQIVLPASRTKNSREHVVPMTAPVKAILEARPRRPDRDFVFGRRQDRGFTGWSATKKMLDARIVESGAVVAPWTNHDARRSASTRMAELGVAPHVIEAVLNHVSGHKAGVHGIYNRALYESQKRAALTVWSEHLLAIVTSDEAKVSPLTRDA